MAPLATAQSNQDLLAEIFGSSNTPSTGTVATPSQPQKSTVDDILSLFGTSSQTPVPASTSTGPSASFAPSSLPPTPVSAFPSTPAVATPVQPPQQRLTAYPAYEKNGLKISLTPQPLAARPGVVMILARFQVTGSETAINLNFQAAVPKVFLQLLAPSWN